MDQGLGPGQGLRDRAAPGRPAAQSNTGASPAAPVAGALQASAPRVSATSLRTAASAPRIAWSSLEWDRDADGQFVVLGAGGSARVYAASYAGMRVAVKELSGLSALLGGQAEVGAFMREASLQATLQHDHVVRVLGVAADKAAGRYGLVMDLCDGSLEGCIAGLAPRTRLEFARQVAAGLEYMHSRRRRPWPDFPRKHRPSRRPSCR